MEMLGLVVVFIVAVATGVILSLIRRGFAHEKRKLDARIQEERCEFVHRVMAPVIAIESKRNEEFIAAMQNWPWPDLPMACNLCGGFAHAMVFAGYAPGRASELARDYLQIGSALGLPIRPLVEPEVRVGRNLPESVIVSIAK